MTHCVSPYIQTYPHGSLPLPCQILPAPVLWKSLFCRHRSVQETEKNQSVWTDLSVRLCHGERLLPPLKSPHPVQSHAYVTSFPDAAGALLPLPSDVLPGYVSSQIPHLPLHFHPPEFFSGQGSVCIFSKQLHSAAVFAVFPDESVLRGLNLHRSVPAPALHPVLPVLAYTPLTAPVYPYFPHVLSKLPHPSDQWLYPAENGH